MQIEYSNQDFHIPLKDAKAGTLIQYDDRDKSLYIIMQPCVGGSIANAVKPLMKEEEKVLLCDVNNGLLMWGPEDTMVLPLNSKIVINK
jgi:hypothetical protein